MYILHQNISIDESLVKCRARFAIIQYNPSKRARFGIKMYKLSDSSNGYIVNFKIYVGQDKCAKDSGPVSAKVVYDLMNFCNLLDKGYNLFIDNWYTSPDLVFQLHQQHKTNVCGTVQCNRQNMPRDLLTSKLARGETCIKSYNNILCVRWKDKKDVTMLTTMHTNAELVDTGKIKRCVKDGSEVEVPRIVIDYNAGMGGVDKGDQVLSGHHIMRRYVKAYRKIFFNMLDMSIFNSFIIFQTLGDPGDPRWRSG